MGVWVYECMGVCVCGSVGGWVCGFECDLEGTDGEGVLHL